MPTAQVSLSQMVDLALGTPEVGAVNFNVLHSLFHAIIQKLNISEHKANIPEEDREFLSKKKPDDNNVNINDAQSEADSAVTGLGTAPSSASRKERTGHVPYHALEQKVAQLQDRLEALNDLPSNSELFERAKGDGEKSRPISEMWQNMQLAKRVDVNEDGINKLMSLMEDMMGDMQKLRDQNDQLQKDLQKALEEAAKAGSLADNLDDLMKRLSNLENLMDDMNKKLDKLDQYPDPELFNDFVTWSGLEDALKGLRDSVNDLTNQEKPVVIDMSSQTGSTSRTYQYSPPRPAKSTTPPHPRSPEYIDTQSRPQSSMSRTSTPGPSTELVNILEKLGKLSDEHDKLEERVNDIEGQLKNKADKGDLDGLGSGDVPEGLTDQLKNLADQLEALRKGQNKLRNDLDNKQQINHQQIIEIVMDEKNKDKQENGKEHTDIVKPELKMEVQHKPEPKLEVQLKPEVKLEVQHKPEPKPSVKLEEIVKVVEVPCKVAPYNLKEDAAYVALRTDVDELQAKLEDVNDDLSGLRDVMLSGSTDTPIPSTVSDSDQMSVRSKCDESSPSWTRPPSAQPEAPVASTMPPSGDSVSKNLLEDSLARISSDLKQKIRMVSQEAKRQLNDTRDKIHAIETRLKNMAESLQEALDSSSVGGRDNETLARLQQAIHQLQSELERLNDTTQTLVDQSSNHSKDIQKLVEQCNKLEENKADKEYVQTEVEVKADKRHLDGKVNRSLFDSTCDDLNKMINDILGKLCGHEDEWKKAVGQLTDDLDGKLDRLEFGPIRDELERQLKSLLKRINNLRFSDMDEDDAAGIRKQLVQKFHCISCDRPVEMAPQGPIPSIPAPDGLPATRSMRPYTTFELDTIRQHAKRGKCTNRYCKGCTEHNQLTNFERAVLERQAARSRMHDFRAYFVHYGKDGKPYKQEFAPAHTQVDVMELFATQRACGGPHTLTYPQRRMTRMAQYNTLFREEEPVPPGIKEAELEIQGADGHIYKGRKDDKLPQLAQPQVMGSPVKQDQGPYPPGNPGAMPSARSPRPGSARLGSARLLHPGGSRPSSARDLPHTDVPTGREFITPPPGPAPSEPDGTISPKPAHIEQLA